MRALWREELDTLRGYAARLGQRATSKATWIERLLPNEKEAARAFGGSWRRLRSYPMFDPHPERRVGPLVAVSAM
jgi:hypothetical protein